MESGNAGRPKWILITVFVRHHTSVLGVDRWNGGVGGGNDRFGAKHMGAAGLLGALTRPSAT